MSIWDHTAKKRLRQYLKYVIGVQDIAFDVDGSWLAMGVSYGWEHGEDACSYFLAAGVDAATVWARARRDKVRGCGERERERISIKVLEAKGAYGALSYYYKTYCM